MWHLWDNKKFNFKIIVYEKFEILFMRIRKANYLRYKPAYINKAGLVYTFCNSLWKLLKYRLAWKYSAAPTHDPTVKSTPNSTSVFSSFNFIYLTYLANKIAQLLLLLLLFFFLTHAWKYVTLFMRIYILCHLRKSMSVFYQNDLYMFVCLYVCVNI